MSRNDYERGIELVATSDNTVMTHTFSKIHGLAALRIGSMFGPADIVDAVNRTRGPFNVSTPAMLAAVAAIEDTAHQQMSKAYTEKWRDWLTEEIGKLGLKVTPSVANFVLTTLPKRPDWPIFPAGPCTASWKNMAWTSHNGCGQSQQSRRPRNSVYFCPHVCQFMHIFSLS